MPEQKWKAEPSERRVRVEVGGQTIAESGIIVLVIEHPGELHYYFPLADVRRELLSESGHVKASKYRGDATY